MRAGELIGLHNQHVDLLRRARRLQSDTTFAAATVGCRRGVAHRWHSRAMPRTRISTTVDATLLARARDAHGVGTDAALFDAALSALLARLRATEIDAGYAAYDEHPLDEADEWGDLAAFRRAAAAT
jgi:Arc/MetJ family transcription regulator